MQAGPLHEALKPLEWLIGKWKSTTAIGIYPTIKPFNYCEEINFESVGQPIINYNSITWHPEKHNPMHLESGFLRIQPETNHLAFMVAHNFGLTSLEEGTVNGNEITLTSQSISRMTFTKEPKVLSIKRNIKLNENGQLEMVVCMETDKTELTKHLTVVYNKV